MAFLLAARKEHRHIELPRMLALRVNDWQQAYGSPEGRLAVENNFDSII